MTTSRYRCVTGPDCWRTSRASHPLLPSLRASLRKVDEDASRVGAPVLPCREAVAVLIGQDVQYRIPLVPNARRFKAGHRIRLHLTSDDQDPKAPAIMGSGTQQWARARSTRSDLSPDYFCQSS